MATTFDEIHHAIREQLFTPPKPKNEQTEKDKVTIQELESKGNLMIQRKDDGHGHIDVIGKKSKGIDIYTLGLNLVTAKYPSIVSDLHSIRFPEKTIICSEISCVVEGIQDRGLMGKFTGSGLESALRIQSEGLVPQMALFNTLMWNGEDVSNWSNHDRYQCLLEHMRKYSSSHVRMIELLEIGLDEARKRAHKEKWEGLVLYDKGAPTKFVIGEAGKSQPVIPRPDGAWKDKVGLEVDFVAYDFVRSTAANHAGAVKDFFIGLIDPHTGEIIPCGKCGTGLSKEERFAYAEPGMLPVAVEVGFEKWSKHGKTLLGKIHRIRDPKDKPYTQCVATEEQMAQVLTRERVKPTW